jgi:small subunit ribosomal protein S1
VSNALSSKESSEQTWYDLFVEEYDYKRPKTGQVLYGIIIRIEEDTILVDVGLKRDAVISAKDLASLPMDVKDNLKVGDRVTVYVTEPGVGDQDLLVSLARGIEYESWEKAASLMKEATIVPLDIIGQNKGGLLVVYDSLRGFIPDSKIPTLRNIHDRQRVEKIKRDMVGTQINVKAIEVNPEHDRLVFSAEAAVDELRKKRLHELEKDQIIKGKVVNIVPFGVFVDIGGIDGLVHISELDWQRVERPSDVVKIGEEIEVKVLDFDLEREQVSLSRKALLPSPWKLFAENHKVGDVVEGRVTNVLNFGAFIEMPEGIQGLVPTREIGYTPTTSKPQEVVSPEERVLVRIVEIEPQKERVTLSMRRVPVDAQISWTAKQWEDKKNSAKDPEVNDNPVSSIQ